MRALGKETLRELALPSDLRSDANLNLHKLMMMALLVSIIRWYKVPLSSEQKWRGGQEGGAVIVRCKDRCAVPDALFVVVALLLFACW